MLLYGSIVEPRTSNNRLLKSAFSAENFSWFIPSDFDANILRSTKVQKHTSIRYFSGSRSFKVIDVGIAGKLVTSVCYDRQQSVSICHHFHIRQAAVVVVVT